MLKKIVSAVAAIAVLASVWALSLTPAFAEEGDESMADTADFPEENKDYSWYEDKNFQPPLKNYDWQFEGIKGMGMEMDMDMEMGMDMEMDTEDWSDEEYDTYWQGYEWKEGAWDDQAYGYYHLYEKVDELMWLLDEISAIYEQYALEGVEMPVDINDGLTAITDEANTILSHEKLAPLYDIARDGIEGSDDGSLEKDYLDDIWNADYSGDLEALLQTIGEFWGQMPWDMVDYAWDNLYGYYSAVDVRGEIEWMLEDLSTVATFVEALVSLEINDFKVKWAVDNLEKLIPEAQSTLEKMLELADQNPAEMDSYWEILDDMEMVFYDNMEAINEYFDEHPDALEELYSLVSEDDIEIIAFWLEEPLMEPEYDFEGDFEKYYGGIEYEYEDGKDFKDVFADTFEEDMYNKIMHGINARVMEEVMPYFEDMIAKAMISNIMTYIDVLGEEMANMFLANQSAMLEIMDFDINNAGTLKGELEKLHKRVKATVVPDSFRNELENALEDLKSRVALGATNDEIKATMESVRAVLDKIDYENIFGEKPVAFYDLPLNEEPLWCWDDVAVARNENIISGYTDEKGEPTGYFGPSNDVTYAEALKMTMETAGYKPMFATDEVNEPWYGGYLKSLDNLELERIDSKFTTDWNAPAPRGDILIMSNEILGIKPAAYVDGTFADIKPGDKLAEDAMASSIEGIFTGDSETHNLRPNGYINRCEFAKVTNTALEHLGQINFVDELGKFEKTLVK